MQQEKKILSGFKTQTLSGQFLGYQKENYRCTSSQLFFFVECKNLGYLAQTLRDTTF